MPLLFQNPNETLVYVFKSESDAVITDDIRKWIDSVLNALIFVFGLLGIFTNAINIRVFVQQGVSSDSNTIGLFSLAVADFFGCVLLIPATICDLLKYTAAPDVAFNCATMTQLGFTLPHAAMSRVTTWITVYIAIERCLCVLIPFKVKLLLRPRVTTMAMISIYLLLISMYVPMMSQMTIEWQFNSRINATVATIVEHGVGELIVKYSCLTLNIILSTIAGFIVSIATGLMLYKINEYKKWRENFSSTGSSKEDTADSAKPNTAQGNKDIEVLKMVLMITGLFLGCLAMSLMPGIASVFVPQFSFSGTNLNLHAIFHLYKYFFDTVNSSLNFFFYIRVSSRYKAAFNAVFRN